MAWDSAFGGLKTGDVIITFPHLKWSFKNLWHNAKLLFVYWQIKRHQKKDYGKYANAIHVAVVYREADCLFEVTFPKAKFSPLDQYAGQRVVVCRPKGGIPNVQAFRAMCDAMDDTKYDIMELVDFTVSRWFFRKTKRRLGVLDSIKQFVCSTGVARALQAGGAILDKLPLNIRPAYFPNRPKIFTVMYDGLA